MITDDEVMRVLEQANPASVDDPIPMLDIAGYREVLDASHITMTLIDSEQKPTESSSGRRWMILIAAAAAVVVAIAVAATRYEYVTPADQPSPTVTVPPAPPPRALLAVGSLEPGTYFVDEIDGTPTPRIYFTIGAGWNYNSNLGDPGAPPPSISNVREHGHRYTSGGSIEFSRSLPSAVFSDACHWSDGYHPGPVDTVDGLVAALSEQGGWADVTGPSDISIDGYAGKELQRTAPADISDCDTMNWGPRLSSPGLHPAFRGGMDTASPGSIYEPGSIETLWVLDIDGTVVVINTMLLPSEATATVAEGPSAADRAEFAAVLDSIRIDRG